MGWAFQPILRSCAPKERPSLPVSTSIAEMPRGCIVAGADHGEIEIGEAAAGDEGLRAVEGPAIGRRGGFRAQGGGVGARAGFGEAVGADGLHGQEAGQVAGAQRFGTVARDHPGAHVVDRQEARDRRAGFRQRLEDQNGVEAGEAGAALGLGHIHRGEAEGGGVAQHVAGHRARILPGGGMGRDALGAEAASHVGDGDLVVGEGEIHHGVPRMASGAGPLSRQTFEFD